MTDLTKKYIVAGHTFALVICDDLKFDLSQYEPFITETGSPLFTLEVHRGTEDTLSMEFAEESRQDTLGQLIVSGTLPDGRRAIRIGWEGYSSLMVSDPDYTQATLYIDRRYRNMTLEYSLMLIYAFSTAPLLTLSLHASSVVADDQAYLFLGVSGTGKSTHSRLWLENIPGTWLLNDDHPVVRINADGKPIVYGSPWSGKTRCYIPEKRPLGGVVQLSQAKANVLRRLSPVEAYVNLINSVAGKRWERRMADGIHSAIEAMVASAGCWHMACLPDADAAFTCYNGVNNISPTPSL
ncbi:MAG: hypothetical protein ACI4UN_04810 [Muribaculaceae bacterium]